MPSQNRNTLAIRTKMSGDGKGKTILVTGGGGYIGSHCVHELLVEEYDVVAIDNFANSVPGIQDSAKIHIGWPRRK